MASKTKQIKAPTVYAFVLYGGIIKGGYTYVETSAQHPEVEQDGNILFDSYKKYFGHDLKGKYVKCQKPLEEITDSIIKSLSEHKYGESDNIYRYNSTDVVKVLKEATGAKQAYSLGGNDNSEDTEEKTVVKKVPKKPVAKTEDTEEATPAPKKTVAKKTVAKKSVPVEEAEAEEAEVEEAEEVEEETPAPKKTVVKKTVAKKTVPVEAEVEIEAKATPSKKTLNTPAKSTGKTPPKKVTTELDDELEDDVVVQTKSKTPARTNNKTSTTKTQIIISDNEEEEDA